MKYLFTNNLKCAISVYPSYINKKGSRSGKKDKNGEKKQKEGGEIEGGGEILRGRRF